MKNLGNLNGDDFAKVVNRKQPFPHVVVAISMFSLLMVTLIVNTCISMVQSRAQHKITMQYYDASMRTERMKQKMFRGEVVSPDTIAAIRWPGEFMDDPE